MRISDWSSDVCSSDLARERITVFESLAFLAILILGVMLADTRSRLKRAEATLAEAAKRISALQRHTGVRTGEESTGSISPDALPATEPSAKDRRSDV